ncbi:uncharacterized protein BO80DRAFT_469972 [Aspergillus ibericus CBS 121593]|uniref:Uncharacterized protein n=1 Tax=Aspergillus ibericus CBS 121593 TaxID=1448316 RepID=A0A395HDN7_9EURO|nr:hypothetical protein BO80DRAFT_469972 [Aspergillus ibericus CBS 121593]RAL06091.1 hypothetical protein BO80DRAFT_469972 [Aspergillus ibericus CBS 121593]
MGDAARPGDDRSLVCQTPPFLGDGIVTNEPISFACEEKSLRQGKDSLVVNGQSTWKVSKGVCDLQPRVLPKQLLLGVSTQLTVRLSKDSSFSNWPGVQGIAGYDNGNYLSVLYLAWAYILSARWVELLGRSADHECHMGYTPQDMEDSQQPIKQPMVRIDLGDSVCEEEARWWRSILCSDGGWNATTRYNDHVYLSPWSVSAEDAGLDLSVKGVPGADKLDPPESGTAVKYLSRFCMHHRIYSQCSAALAGALYIPFVRGRTVSLPFPKQVSPPEVEKDAGNSNLSIPDLLSEHDKHLSKYMTLSSNVWGLRSLLCSTFFNADIESYLTTLLANRQPRLGPLWLGAILTDVAKSVLRDIRTGNTALDLLASAWTGTAQTFLTSNMACEGHERPPIWPWKPFGYTWEWLLTNGYSILDDRKENIQPADHASHSSARISAALNGYHYDFFSQDLSEGATRGIFAWLRSTGYPRNERSIY